MAIPAEFNLAEAQKVMKEIVAPEVPKLYDESPILMNLINDGKTRTTFTNSRGVRLTADVEPLPTHAWRSEGSDFSIGGSDEKVNMSVTFVEYSIARQLTGSAIDCTSRETIVDTLSRFVEKDGMAANKEWNQQGYGNGSGSKAIVQTRTSGTVVTFALPKRARQVLKGAKLAFHAGTAGTRNSGGQSGATYAVGDQVQALANVSAKVNSTGAVTFDAVPTDVIAGDIVVYAGNGVSGYGRTIRGLDSIISDSTGMFQGGDRSVYDGLRAYVYDAQFNGLSVEMIDATLAETLYKTGADESVDDFIIISAPTQEHAYKKLGFPLQRQMMGVPGSTNLDRGFKTISYNGLKWIVDTDCPPDKIFFLRRSTLMKFEVTKMKPLKLNGELLQPLPGTTGGAWKDKYVYYLGCKSDLGCDSPNKNAQIKNLAYAGLPLGGVV